jgi:hypothetical protein
MSFQKPHTGRWSCFAVMAKVVAALRGCTGANPIFLSQEEARGSVECGAHAGSISFFVCGSFSLG